MNNSLIVGKVAIELDSVDSTNRYASELLASKTRPFEGTVILAREQTSGRGQYGATWESPAKSNLYMSLILYPSFLPAADQFLLSQAVSLGILDTIRTYGEKDFSVKWPNDVFCGDSKLGGVLIENTLRGTSLATSVVGIGLNLNSFPTEISRATSLTDVLHREISVSDFRERLFAGLEKRYLQLRSGQHHKLRTAYVSGLYGVGVPKRYRVGTEEFVAQVRGVTPSGLLELESQSRGREQFAFKEVMLVD